MTFSANAGAEIMAAAVTIAAIFDNRFIFMILKLPNSPVKLNPIYFTQIKIKLFGTKYEKALFFILPYRPQLKTDNTTNDDRQLLIFAA